VRKEIRSLTAAEWDKVAAALNVMKTTTQATGATNYGADFKSYDYFVAKHAASATDSRGDQAHFSSAFMTWHALFLLEFELSLLAIDASIGAMPYWDMTVSTPSIFTATYFGSAPGTGTGSQVIDGKFANWAVKSGFLLSDYVTGAGATVVYSGSSATPKMLRQGANANPNAFVTRYGPNTFSFDATQFYACLLISAYWMDWYYCLENGKLGATGATLAQSSAHSGAHVTIGGQGTYSGDFKDPVTSPNDPLFMFHHANLDRHRFFYQTLNKDKKSIYYGFPTTGAITQGSTVYAGLALADTVASGWGFSQADVNVGAQSAATKLTHADALCYLDPSTAPYTYFDLAACLASSSTTTGCPTQVRTYIVPTSTSPTCSCPNGTPTLATGSGSTLCEANGNVDCSACASGYVLSAPAGSGTQTCGTIAGYCTTTPTATNTATGFSCAAATITGTCSTASACATGFTPSVSTVTCGAGGTTAGSGVWSALTCSSSATSSNVNCVSSYSACDSRCVKHLTITTPASGTGTACPDLVASCTVA